MAAFAAMAAAGVMVTAFNALPGSITNTYNIAWNHAYRMSINDPFITGFLEGAIGYSPAQMAALFADMPGAMENTIEIAKRKG